MSKYQPMVQESTQTTGTGTIVLGGATTGHRTFASAFTEDDYVPYMLIASDGGMEWGYGRTVDLAGTPDLERSFIHGSTNAGAAITLPTGAHTVSCGILPDLRERRGFRLENGHFGVTLSETIATGVYETIYWTGAPWDTEDLFSGFPGSPLGDLVIPAWVDKINVNFNFDFYTVGVTDPGGDRFIKIESLDSAWNSGYPLSQLPAAAGEDHASNLFGLNIPLIGSSSSRGFRCEVMQDSGQTLKHSANDAKVWLQCEFVE